MSTVPYMQPIHLQTMNLKYLTVVLLISVGVFLVMPHAYKAANEAALDPDGEPTVVVSQGFLVYGIVIIGSMGIAIGLLIPAMILLLAYCSGQRITTPAGSWRIG